MSLFKNPLIFIFVFSFIYVGNLFGQFDADATPYDSLGNKKRKVLTLNALDDIKRGYLVIRLSSEGKRINTIDELISNDSLSEDKRSRLVRKRKSVIKEKEKTNRLLYDSFSKSFEFSEVLFLYDTSIYHLVNGEESGYFLDSTMQIDETISLKGLPYRVARYGRAFQSSRSTRSLYVMDQNFNDLKIGPKFITPIYGLGLIFRPYESQSVFSSLVRSYSRRLEKAHYKMSYRNLKPD